MSPKQAVEFSQIEQVCRHLGIRIYKDYSPLSKGRVERKHGVFQDRFVKELKLKNIKTLDEANALLENGFVDHLNKKFARLPKEATDAHREAKPYGDLEQIFCWEYERQVQNERP